MAAKEESSSEMYDIIKCPVCYDLLKPPIYQCDRGHHLCKQCHQKLRLEECPLCKAYFYGTRNFLAEDMIEKLQGLNVSQQTNLMQNLKRDARTVSHPSFCRGKFPCVFKSCKTEHPVGRMLPHIRYHHPTMLSEVVCTDKFKEVWEVEYLPDCTYETAVRISNMGLFYLMVNVGCKGELHAIVQMVASEEVATTFKYKVNVSSISGHKRVTYSNEVLSCRESKEGIRDSGFCLRLSSKEMLNICQYGETFQCKLSVKSENAEVET